MQLRKANRTPPLVRGAICPAAAAQCELRGAQGRWDRKSLGTQPQRKKSGKSATVPGSLGLMLGVGPGPCSSVKEKHPREGRAQLRHPHSSLLQGPGPRRPPKQPRTHPPPQWRGWRRLGRALSLTPQTTLTRSLTRGRDLRPGLMSGMLLMQRRNLTAAPLSPGMAQPGQRKENRKQEPY